MQRELGKISEYRAEDQIKHKKEYGATLSKIFRKAMRECPDGGSFFWPKEKRSLAYIYAKEEGYIIKTKSDPEDKDSILVFRLGTGENYNPKPYKENGKTVWPDIGKYAPANKRKEGAASETTPQPIPEPLPPGAPLPPEGYTPQQ